MMVLRLPSMKSKFTQQMDQAKLDIENKLVPKGAEVVRHLSLPEEGKSLEWILAEIEKMDTELEHRGDWRHGKLSGAVYRTRYHSSTNFYSLLYQMAVTTWRRSS